MKQNLIKPMPHTSETIFVTEAGLETWLVFLKEIDLPEFAAFPLLRSEPGRLAMEEYIEPFFETARQNNAGFIVDTCTWRANPDWGQVLGYDRDALLEVNREAVTFAQDARDRFGAGVNVLINGVIGPRGDGYDPATIMSVSEAQSYHQFQIETLADSDVDLVTSLTMTNTPEAIGIARAAAQAHVPCVISFTLETDGRLPTGQALADAIAEVDKNCDQPPIYYMLNCAHPDHFADMLEADPTIGRRIRGVRANASRMSHAELDVCEVLDDGNPHELGQQYADLRRVLPNLNVVGGCCGTDHRHISEICKAMCAA